MPDTFLALGGFIFLDPFSVPERISAGGAHHLVTHKLIGGQRIVTALGADDDSIKWRGRFRGPAAVVSCQLLDVMRRSGKQVQLSYWTSSYLVVVRRFTWEFERFYEIPYEIECEVVQDLTATFWSGVSDTLDSLIDTDLGLAGGFGGGVTSINQAMAAALTARAAVGVLQGASDLGGLISAVGAVSAAATIASLAADGVGLGVAAGGDPGAMAGSVSSTADAFTTAGAGAQTSGVAGRMAYNLDPGTGLIGGGV